MGRETTQIRRNIAETRQEIDTHLSELGGRVERARSQLDVEAQAQRNLPQVLGGAAIAGLLLGLIVGRRRRRMYSPYAGETATEQARLAREWRRMAKERERMAGATGLAEITAEEPIP